MIETQASVRNQCIMGHHAVEFLVQVSCLALCGCCIQRLVVEQLNWP